MTSAPEDEIRFLVIGDWGRRGAPGQREVARAMADAAAERGCRFVVTTGDNFYEDGVAGLEDPHWRESFENVYDQPSLQVPWYVCLGNHDWRGDVSAQVAYSGRSPRWHLPDRHYAVRPEGPGAARVELVVLDTTPLVARYRRGGVEEIPAAARVDPRPQRDWIERVLSSPAPTWRFVVGHHPVLSGSPYHGSTPDLLRDLQPLLDEHSVDAYLCGHEHDLQHLEQGDQHHLVSGAAAESRITGELPQTLFAAGRLGFLVVSAGPDRLELTFLDETGATLHTHAVAARRRLVA